MASQFVKIFYKEIEIGMLLVVGLGSEFLADNFSKHKTLSF